MSDWKIGDRVGAIEKADDTKVYLYGYGIFAGRDAPYQSIPDFINPHIKLDDGQEVWGMQCWWASEEHVKRMVGDREIVMVSVPPLHIPAA